MAEDASSNRSAGLPWHGGSDRLRNFVKSVHGPGIRAASFRGSILSVGGFAAQKVIQLASNLILTRILFPEAFGIMALASTFLVGITMFSDLGIHQAIVRSKRGEEEVYLNTAWTAKILRGVVIWLVTCILAWPASKLYDQPILFHVLCVLGISAVIQGVASTGVSTLNRKLQFKRIVILEFIRSVISTVVTIAFALWLKSVWALVIGTLIGGLVTTIFSHKYLASHRHRICWDQSSLAEIIRFGRWIMLSTLATFLGSTGQPLIQGYFVSTETLGLLAIAMTFVGALYELFDKLISSVGFPALSKVNREHPARLNAVIHQLKLFSNILGVSAFLLLSLLSNFVIELLYDPRYIEAGTYMAILAINGAILFLRMLYLNVALAKSDSRSHFYMQVATAITCNTGMLLGYHAEGLLGMLYGLCLGSLFGYFVSVAIAHRKGFACKKVDAVAIGAIAAYVVWAI